MEVQNQVGRSLRGNLARLRDVPDGAAAQGIGGLGRIADSVCETFDLGDGRAHLHRVVGLCRFRIRPRVACRNLASCVMGRAARTVGEDFERLYGYGPWLLKTFVDETGHPGTSWRAANWVRVGRTRGPGRQDRTHAAPHAGKAVYVYELEPAWRESLTPPAPGSRRWHPAMDSTPGPGQGTSSAAPRWAMRA